MEPYSYYWLLVITGCFAFVGGFSIGTNDLANSFSASVASKALTLKQACSIAIVTEFSGAFFLGEGTAETLRSNLINIDHFKERPDLLMLGMACALIGSSIWNLFASNRGLPVSTTHSIIGAILGIGVAAFGFDVIKWDYNGGVLKIFVSWIISPIVAGLVAAFIFLITQYFILEAEENSFERGLVAVPIYFGITIGINALFFVYKGAPVLKLDQMPGEEIAPVVIGLSLIVAAFSYFFFAQWIRRKVIDNEDLKIRHIFFIPFINARFKPNGSIHHGNSGDFDTFNSNDNSNNISEGFRNNLRVNDQECRMITQQDTKSEISNPAAEIQKKKSIIRTSFDKIIMILSHGLNKDVATYRREANQELYDVATKYDRSTESLYTFLQVLTSALASFVHGSNDVANAIGPLATVLEIYERGEIGDSSQIPVWVLALGGAAIDMGLLFYGYNVMRSLGNQITYHSPSRGFSMELGTSLTVLTASRLGLPISTTQCITGATIGVGLCNGTLKAINWKIILWCTLYWALTLPAAGILSGSIFYFVVNAPNLR